MSDLKLTRGAIYWTKHGEKCRRLAVVLILRPQPGYLYVLARTFSTVNEKWYPPRLLPRSMFVAQAEPGDYATRRALSFADLDLTKALLSPKTRPGPRPRPATKKAKI